MACSLKVLMDVSDELQYKLTKKEIQSLRTKDGAEKHRDVLREIYESSCSSIMMEGGFDGCLKGAVDYFEDRPMSFEDAQESKGYGFGAMKPDEIREEMLSWNHNTSMNLIRLLGEFEKTAEKEGFVRLSELFTSCIKENGRIDETRFHYPASVYELRKALDAVEGVFTYGQYKLSYRKDGYVNPYIPAEAMEQAREHPEDFLILEVYYD